jgi:hypothetical protein
MSTDQALGGRNEPSNVSLPYSTTKTDKMTTGPMPTLKHIGEHHCDLGFAILVSAVFWADPLLLHLTECPAEGIRI